MRLTGIPLFLLVATAAVGTMAATVRGWRRLPVRIAGLLAVEILAVAAIGLWVNRSQRFYPTWESLTGASQVAAVTETAAGRLDPRLAGATAVAWKPAEAAAWHLARPPLLLAPPDYAEQPDRTFPLLVVLGDDPGTRPAGVLTVVLAPTRATTAASLGTLRAAVARDARSADALAVVAGPRWHALAAAWPGHPAVATGIDQAVRGLPAPLAAPQRLPS
ncbi:hypothetical protein BJY16_004850 [Actinoplanes octamycinicus]|uniref:Uncharacterized protein n=1 Tax=Actinoplanes octamycinicus TaxID=135948 RepID=A0A7W7M930_9ACTN|nr:hypothetical protein [Actinoplanes octamycinicus]MBB4741391.1 hypothetical protein [Actinoplanes octamycinicus]GIE62810.1 hypothetical protein Aoc01nite_82120 [Actinoplanes octamycinicus]